MIFIITQLIYLTIAKEYTLIVHEGNLYSSPTLKYETKNKETVEALITLSSSAADYFIPEGDDQKRCMGSWNKLWGYSRCLGSHHHTDSDRFVFRRVQTCLKYEDGRAIEIPECEDQGLIEIAAYAYDDGQKPYEHQGRLLKPFYYLIKPNVEYLYRISFFDEQTLYELIDVNGTLIEKKIIDHRKCLYHKMGYRLSLYFGGVCPSPIEISAHYSETD